MPIIENASKPELLKTKRVNLFQTRDDIAEGVLNVGENSYDVLIHYEEDFLDARVSLLEEIPDTQLRRRIILHFAEAALANREYDPLAVDVLDGETVYHRDLTADLSADALDRFFDQAAKFIEERGPEILMIANSKEPADDGGGSDPGFNLAEII